ncbi:MAG TPA: hypothetical protein VED46_11515 [Alphaproteobacteria bacterium]|nr:hypothetical protein [Alphaproteobacteria bacterium]
MNPSRYAAVDLKRYPIDDLESSQAQAVIAEGRAALARDGLALFPGFIASEALAAMAAEAEALVPRAFRRDEWYSIYSYENNKGDADLPEGHARRRRFRSSMGAIAYDLLPADSVTRALYECPALTRFIAAVTGEAELYTCADPLASCVITVLQPGDTHAWHYDQNDFVVSLLLQAAERGGAFEYAPNIRSEDDENYQGVARMLDDEPGLKRTGAITPGCLALFRGRRSLHHVTEVEGTRPRLIALFSYDRKPGMMFNREVHIRALGRTVAV